MPFLANLPTTSALAESRTTQGIKLVVFSLPGLSTATVKTAIAPLFLVLRDDIYQQIQFFVQNAQLVRGARVHRDWDAATVTRV